MQTPSPSASESSEEAILWSGSPDPQGVRAAALARVRTFRVAACAVAVIAMLVAVQLDPANWGGNARIPVIIAAIGGLAAAAATAWPSILGWRAGRTTYAVTRRGIVISEHLFGQRCRRFGVERLLPLRVVPGEEGRGDVYFAVCPAGLARLFGPPEGPVGFISIPDPEEAARVITEALGIPRATRLP